MLLPSDLTQVLVPQEADAHANIRTIPPNSVDGQAAFWRDKLAAGDKFQQSLSLQPYAVVFTCGLNNAWRRLETLGRARLQCFF